VTLNSPCLKWTTAGSVVPECEQGFLFVEPETYPGGMAFKEYVTVGRDEASGIRWLDSFRQDISVVTG
jgi:hypothetical protein